MMEKEKVDHVGIHFTNRVVSSPIFHINMILIVLGWFLTILFLGTFLKKTRTNIRWTSFIFKPPLEYFSDVGLELLSQQIIYIGGVGGGKL